MFTKRTNSNGSLSVVIPCDEQTANRWRLLDLRSEYKEILHKNWLNALNCRFDRINEFVLITLLEKFPALDSEIQSAMTNKQIAQECHVELEDAVKRTRELLELMKDINSKVAATIAELEAKDVTELNSLISYTTDIDSKLVLRDIAIMKSDVLFNKLTEMRLLLLAKRHRNDKAIIIKIMERLFALKSETQLHYITSLHDMLVYKGAVELEVFELADYDIRVKTLFVIKLLQDFVARRTADAREYKSSFLFITIGPSKNTELAAAGEFIKMLNEGVTVERWQKLNPEYKKALLQSKSELNYILNVFNTLCKSEIIAHDDYDAHVFNGAGLH